MTTVPGLTPTIRLRNLNYDIDCAICLEPLNTDAYVVPCGDAWNREAHPRCHQECIQDHFNQLRKVFGEENNSRRAQNKPLLDRLTYTCPVDGHNLQSQPGEPPICTADHELVAKVTDYVKKNPAAFTQPANNARGQPRPVARSRSSCPPGLAIAGGLFLLSAIAYAVNQLCFAGASAVLGVIGFPASLIIIPIVYLLQQLVQLLVALAQAASGAAAAI